jgi:hypothetical protein
MIHSPVIAIWDDGSAHFQDGRHTFVAMRDSDYTHVPVIVRDEDSFRNVTDTKLPLGLVYRPVHPANYYRRQSHANNGVTTDSIVVA